MSEMVERVMRVICQEHNSARDAARAAIEAMRDPTDEMIQAAGGPSVNLERADDPSYEPLLVWQDMIDAALKTS